MALLAPAALFVAVYAGLGRRALLDGMRDRPVAPRSAAFVALLVLVLGVAAASNPMYAMLQAVAYPMVWTIANRVRDAVLACAAVAAGIGAGISLGLVGLDPASALATSLVTAPVSFVFAVVMGLWISRIHAQGERYRELADELRRSRDEVAALSAAAGAAEERERLSRDLHDTLTQTLTGLVMLGEQAERALDAGDEARARDRLARVASASRAAVAEARALVATTQPLGAGGLAEAIERVAAGLRADAGLEVVCELAGAGDASALSREREVVLLRAAQEGLANARKHARASRVVVRLAALPDGGAELRVDDDGAGPGSARSGGFGLAGLAERVRAVGGETRFGPRAGGGSRLEVRLPGAGERGRTGP